MVDWKKYNVGQHVVYSVYTEYGRHWNIYAKTRVIGCILDTYPTRGQGRQVTAFIYPGFVSVPCDNLSTAWLTVTENSNRHGG